MKTNYKLKMPKIHGAIVAAFFAVFMLYSSMSIAQTTLDVTIECNGKAVIRDQNTLTTVTTIQGPVKNSLVTLVAGQAITIQTEPGDIDPFQIQGYEVVTWVRSNNYTPPDSPTYTTINKGDPGFESFLNFIMGPNGSRREVTIIFDITDPDITIDPIDDISTVTNTPIIIPVDVQYGSPYTSGTPAIEIYGTDILVDALISTTYAGGFPAGAEIIKISLDGGTTNLLAEPVSVGGDNDLFLSDILGTAPAVLQDEEGKSLEWEITVAGIADPLSFDVKVQSVGYNTDPDAGFDVCHTVFAEQEFEVTFADTQVTPVADLAVCHDDCIELDFVIEYPLIENLDARIMNDAKVTIYTDASKTQTLTLAAGTEIKITGPYSNDYELLAEYSTFYLSALLNDDDPPTSPGTQGPLMGHVGNYTWTFEICGANPGNYYFVIENFAELDDIEYVYDGDEFLVQYVGALGVEIDPIDDIETATNAPVIFEATVNYPQTSPKLDEQNLDADLLIDAVITVDPTLPANTTVAEIQYNGTPLALSITDIGGVGTIRLSEILGSAPALLSDHAGIASDTWKVSIENLDEAGVYSVTFQSVTFLDFDECYSVMDEQAFTVTMEDLDIDDIDDIFSVTKTPVIIPVNVEYPSITPYDNTITVDAEISAVSPTTEFPADTYILGISLDGGTTNLIAAPYDISGMASFLLSDVLGVSPATFIDEDGKALNWEIVIISETTGVTNVLVETIVNYPLSTEDFVLASEKFTLTYAEVTIDQVDDATVCSPDDVVFNWCVSYPLVENVGGDRVLSDSKFTFFADSDLTIPLDLPTGTMIEVTTPAGNVFTSTLTAAVNTVYGSAVVAVQAGDPSTNEYGYILSLERPASTAPACWQVRIIDASPGTIFVNYELLALLDWDGTSYFGATPPFGPHGTFEEFTYKEQDWKVIYVGSQEVSIDSIDDIETITGAPVVVGFEVYYGDLSAENIDDSVMADALITFDPALPSTASIEALYFLNDPLVGLQTVTLDYSLAGKTEILLSEIVGPSAPAQLNLHADNSPDIWDVVFAGLDEAGTYTITVQGIAYVDYDDCYSVTDEVDFTVTLRDIVVDSIDDPDAVCEGEDVIDAEYELEFPVISTSQHLILFNVKVTVSSEIPAGTEVEYSITGLPAGSFSFTSAQPANTPFNLFGPGFIPATIDLGNLNNANVSLSFDFLNLDPGYYKITSEPFATIDSPMPGHVASFGPYDLVTDEDIIQNAWVYPAYEPEIEGDNPVASGTTTPYEIDPQDVFGLLFNEEGWVLTGDVDFDNDGNLVFTGGTTTPTATILTACPGTFSFDYEIETTANTLVYLEVLGIVTPVFNDFVDGIVSGTFSSDILGTYVLTGFTTNPADVTITISNFNFDVEHGIFWSIGTVTNTSDPSGGSVSIVGTVTDVYEVEVEVEWPFTGQYELIVEVSNCAGCTWSDTKTITVLPNQLVGQVKYYNSQESPMPSPFMSNLYGMDVPDYFYVEIWDVGTGSPVFVELAVVNEIYGEENDLLNDLFYEAAFSFETNLDPDGEYIVRVYDGTLLEEVGYYYGYNGISWTWNNWGGVNATDALLILHMAAGSQVNGFSNMAHIGANNLSPMPYGFFAVDVADVNNAGNTPTGITALDALLTSRRSVGLIQKFPNDKPNFAVAGLFVDSDDFNTNNMFGVTLPDIQFTKNDEPYTWGSDAYEHHFDSEALTFGAGFHYLNIYYNAVGDINASYVPVYGGFKEEAIDMQLIVDGQIGAGVGEQVTIPVSITKGADLGALSLGLNYNNQLIEVIGTNYGDDYAHFDHESGTLRVAWASLDGLYLEAGSEVALITVRVLDKIEAGTELFWLTNFTELADINANVIEGIDLAIVELTTDVVGIEDIDAGLLGVTNFPNPFNNSTTISYNLPETGDVKLVVYNNMGQIVKTLVDTNQDAGAYEVTVSSSELNGPGVYYYRLVVNGIYNQYSATKSMVLIK